MAMMMAAPINDLYKKIWYKKNYNHDKTTKVIPKMDLGLWLDFATHTEMQLFSSCLLRKSAQD